MQHHGGLLLGSNVPVVMANGKRAADQVGGAAWAWGPVNGREPGSPSWAALVPLRRS